MATGLTHSWACLACAMEGDNASSQQILSWRSAKLLHKFTPQVTKCPFLLGEKLRSEPCRILPSLFDNLFDIVRLRSLLLLS